MADRTIKRRDLARILRRFDVWEDTSRGKGSHTSFCRKIGDGVFSFPIPTHGTDVSRVYVKALRFKLKLTAADGVTDAQFYD